MIKLIKMEEKTKRMLVFFEKYLSAFLISVVIGFFPTIALSQENLSAVNEVSDSEDNLKKNDSQKTSNDSLCFIFV